MKLKLIAIPVFLLFFSQAYAQWPVGKYRDMFVPSFNFYDATSAWDVNGNKTPNTGNQFQSYSLNLYNVYGLTRKLDIETSLPFVYFQNTSKGGTQNNYGAQDLQIGLNYNVLNASFKQFVNITLSGIAPLYNVNAANHNIGYGEAGADLRVDYFANISKDVLKRSYFTASVSYRKYFGSEGPEQYNGSATLGVGVFKATQLVFNANYINSVSLNKQFNPLIIDIKNFSYFKTSLSIGQVISRRLSVYIGGFDTLFGKNTGIGYGGNVSTVIKI